MDQFRNQEVFIITGPDDNEEPTDLYVTDSRMDLEEQLLLKNPTVDDEIRVFHGVLTLAEYLPPSFHGKSAYIVYVCPDKPETGWVAEAAATPEAVAREIETLISVYNPVTQGEIDIDCLYILYGYQLELGMAINEDDIDEEYIFACSQIAEETSIVEDEIVEGGVEDGE